MSTRDYKTIADSLANSLARTNEMDFTYSYYRSLCKPFITALYEDNNKFSAERFVAFSYEAYRDYMAKDSSYPQWSKP